MYIIYTHIHTHTHTHKQFYDLLLKMYFIYTYIVPWQSSWSSAGHIIIQPLLIPHTPLIFLQTLIAAIMGAPINPVYASTLFILSYVRPVKYWEKDYKYVMYCSCKISHEDLRYADVSAYLNNYWLANTLRHACIIYTCRLQSYCLN